MDDQPEQVAANTAELVEILRTHTHRPIRVEFDKSKLDTFFTHHKPIRRKP